MAEPVLDDTSGRVLLGNRIEIFPDQPIPELNGPAGPAYTAVMKDNAVSLYAIVCKTLLPSRFDQVAAMRTCQDPSIMRLLDAGPVHWVPTGARHYAYIYERPLCGKFRDNTTDIRDPMNEDMVNHSFIAPLSKALSELSRAGIVHGGIRPDNIYWKEKGSAPPMLGDCMTLPVGMTQPILFEPIDRTFCTPIGRGAQYPVDDLYALGVCTLFAILGKNPVAGMDDRALLQAKLEKGSFNTYVGQHRLYPSHIELLRGVLADDPRQRWNAAEFEQWVDGRRTTPKAAEIGRRASRGLEFNGKIYFQVRPLAYSLADNAPEAGKLIENGTLQRWLERSLSDQDKSEGLAFAIQETKSNVKTANLEDQMVTRTSIALEPNCPIRYRGMTVSVTGIAAALADAMINNQNLQVIAEIIGNNFVSFWAEMQAERKGDYVSLNQQFERVKNHIDKTTLGSGLERVLYELNATIPCLSPMIRDQSVVNSKSLLPALDKVANRQGRPREPMDRHIAAFLVARDRRSEAIFQPMASANNPVRYGLAFLELFSDLQSKHGPDSLPGLATWIYPLVSGSLQRFHNRPLREKLQQTAEIYVKRGDIVGLHKLIDDPARLDQDERDYQFSRQLYGNTVAIIAQLEKRLEDRSILVREMGKPVAAVIAGFISIGATLLIVGRALLNL
jgi:eukaryotic-like serine/threonine-protein kinase